MKKILLLLALVAFSFDGIAQDLDSSTYYLIRHAEKDRSDKTERNPHLADKGQKRATRWAEILTNFQLDAVYSTAYHRTIETATPTAEALGIEIQSYHPTQMDMAAFLKETKGKQVLIVGHSNTTAQFANRLIGKEVYAGIADDNNANLYIVTIKGDSIEHVQLKMSVQE